MDKMDKITNLIKALGIFAWPALFAAVLITVLPAIKGMFAGGYGRIELEVAGNRVMVDASKAIDDSIEEIGALQAEIVRLDGEIHDLAGSLGVEVNDSAAGAEENTPPAQGEDAAEPVEAEAEPPAPSSVAVIDHAATAPPARRNILWVDDQPENNFMQIKLLEQQGNQVTLARSTDEALQMIGDSKTPYDAVITDLGRTESGTYRGDAGRELIERLRAQKIETPVTIYTTARNKQDLSRDRAVTSDQNVAVTQSPIELTRALTKTAKKPPEKN